MSATAPQAAADPSVGRHRFPKNATHNFTAKTICLDSESPDDFYTLRRRMLADVDPKGEIECQLVEQMIAARWRLVRLWEIETDLYNQALERNQDSGSPTRRRTQAFEQIAVSNVLEKIGQYENRLSRDYDRCLRRLIELKAIRQREIEQRRKLRDRPPTPIQHSDLLSADEYIRLQNRVKAPVQNEPNSAEIPLSA